MTVDMENTAHKATHESREFGFCCAGCEQVHGLIVGCGLGRYYELRAEAIEARWDLPALFRDIGVLRTPVAPEIPTLAEQGLKDFEAYAWQALVVPAGASAATVQTMNKHLNDALNSTEIKARMQVLGIEPMPTTAAQAASFAAKERERWGKVIREANIKLD